MTTDAPYPPTSATTSPAVESPGVRCPPRLVRVPPPRRQQMPAIPVVLGGVFAILAIVIFSATPHPAAWIGGVFFVVLAAVVPLATWRENARSNRARAALVAAHPGIEQDALATTIAARWRYTTAFPSPDVIATALLTCSGATGPPSAKIVCLGSVDVPEVGDLRFEPYIITATDLLWSRLVSVPLLVIPLALWLLSYAHFLSWRFINPVCLGYPLLMAAGAAITWVWRGLIHPTYVRMAPGIIEVLEYRLGRRKPVIRSYPMDAGTLVIVYARKTPVNVTLLRGQQKDVLPIAQIRRRHDAVEHIWRALLSTAPIPRLSDEELIE